MRRNQMELRQAQKNSTKDALLKSWDMVLRVGKTAHLLWVFFRDEVYYL